MIFTVFADTYHCGIRRKFGFYEVKIDKFLDLFVRI